MGEDRNKIFLPLADRTVLEWSLDAFSSCREITEILLVGRDEDFPEFRKIPSVAKCVTQMVAGGAERFDSVWSGLQKISKNADVVLIHDAARPCITADLIRRTIETACELGGAVVACPVSDTMKRSGDGKTVLKTVPREGLWQAQTPQGFQFSKFFHAYEQAVKERWVTSDDAGVAEKYGIPVGLVLGSRENVKVTTPEDLKFAESILRARSIL